MTIIAVKESYDQLRPGPAALDPRGSSHTGFIVHWVHLDKGGLESSHPSSESPENLTAPT